MYLKRSCLMRSQPNLCPIILLPIQTLTSIQRLHCLLRLKACLDWGIFCVCSTVLSSVHTKITPNPSRARHEIYLDERILGCQEEECIHGTHGQTTGQELIDPETRNIFTIHWQITVTYRLAFTSTTYLPEYQETEPIY